MQTKPNVIHWSEEQPPEENDLRERLAQENLKAYTWGNRPNDIYAAHRHDYHKVIYVISGSITFDLSELKMKITLNAGDRLELPKNLLHSAKVGPNGVRCLEAHR